jgi:MoxR-like ATPase
MLPSDITGVSVFNQDGRVRVPPRPDHGPDRLADEINRATPKTQGRPPGSHGGAPGHRRRQNLRPCPTPSWCWHAEPHRVRGHLPLPEGAARPFLLRISLGYPEEKEEIAILDSQQREHPVRRIEQAVSLEELIQAQEALKEVHISDLVKEYIVALTRATRKHPDVYLGASPRASLALYKTSRALAAINGRDYVIP